MKWSDKRYHSFHYFLKSKFNSKVAKVPIDGGFTCPNRDGTLSKDGCIFCSEKGSGDFAGSRLKTIQEQFRDGCELLHHKWPNARYLPYFQAYTNTYAPVDLLRRLFEQALQLPDIAGIAIGTRPDCLNQDVLSLLHELSRKTFVLLELGLQTSSEKTALQINRCYDNTVFTEAVRNLKKINIHVVAHIILGLPGETKDDMLNTVKFCNENKIDGVKLQLLYILKNTRLANLYEAGDFVPLTIEQYIDIVSSCIEHLPPFVVIHRLTGDAPKDELIAPAFLLDKRKVLNGIDMELKKRNTYQGKLYKSCY